ncbi:type VI secretion system protein ImpA [Epibacterium ulvae]|uniref:Type VI secretion system protein ImpA n=2 Tax=Alphaproteobacteria TaxID=28211 RepID=A0A1G5QHP3_9RHOB|nr:type VI secretion system ImpA family N-terminal domain-containing protein [Epibacterium ulvae]AFT64126.1 conserved hypothetical protein [alpha proteobacterium U95]SCZ61395.1 type VI secretion system protein ImpA [Epibacterium ulvae]
MADILAPIPGDSPYGVFLKGERQIYRGLRNAFNGAQAAWRKYSETPDALADSENQSANAVAWEALAEQCASCLCETSKDLEILSWYVASKLHGHKPFEKTRDALAAMADLLETGFENLQPNPPVEKLRGDTDEVKAAEIAELRLRSFVQLFGEVEGSGLLNAPLTNLPLIGEVTFGKFLLADKDGNLEELKAEVMAHIGGEGQALTSKIEALQSMHDLITGIDKRVKTYATAHGQTPPSIGYGLRQITDMLSAIQRLVEGLGFPWPGEEAIAEEGAAEESVQPEEQSNTGEVRAPAATASGGRFNPTGNVANRKDALKAIAQLATYFRTTEPHSPICLLLDRAVRWGNLSAAELYREILSEGSVGMAQMALMTGLESQGFADRYGTAGAGASGGVEHPTLDNYAAALPVPAATPLNSVPAPAVPVPSAAASAAVPSAQAAPAPVLEPIEIQEENAEVSGEVEDFQW